jgi:hypothetical protein
MHTKSTDDVLPFRVALMLKKYKFGSNMAARYLGKPRGLVQSWMQAGESHMLARQQFKLEAFEKKLKGIRRKITQENIYYLLAMKLIELDLPPEFIGKHLGVPLSTIRSWKRGVAPKGVKKLFVDRNILDKEYKKLISFLKEQSTKQNLQYYLALKLSDAGAQEEGRRRIGGKTISRILTKHFRLYHPIPKETISCWIDGRRTPKNAFPSLKDREIINEEYRKIVDELTHEFMDYHISHKLYIDHNWTYSKISKTMNLDKEKVRGWVTKDRGSPIAKTFRNENLVNEELKRYIVETSFNGGGMKSEESEKEIHYEDEEEDEFDFELEDEILYHLSFFPGGLSSPQAIKSILIENKESEIEDILKILDFSKKIVRKGNKWVLRD